MSFKGSDVYFRSVIVQRFGVSKVEIKYLNDFKKFVILFSKDAFNGSKVTVRLVIVINNLK